jgi:MATE family multidrug resistance protein
MFSLAWPVVLAEIGWMLMGIVDTMMVGRVGPEAIGAVGIGSSVFFGLAVFGLGILLGLDTLVSQAFGAGDLRDCHRWLFHGVYFSLILTVPLTGASFLAAMALGSWGLHPAVEALAIPYLRIVSLSVLPLLLYATFRRYLQAIGLVKPVMFALVSANVVNAIFNWILIFGHFGLPRLGASGAAWATVASRVYMAAVLLGAVLIHDRLAGLSLRAVDRTFSAARLRRLFTLGTPAAGQIVLEVGVFAAVTVLAGKLNPSSLAAHQIAINWAALAFMVPLGVASAGAVRVGHAVGRRDPAGATHAGWTALLLGGAFMTGAALLFVAVPAPLIGLFTTDAAVLGTGVSLLGIAAIFQLFDGVQGVATGVLRGLGDTRTPMAWNFVGHWMIGLPLAYVLCFQMGWGVTGLWTGLCCGLIVVAVVLLRAWSRQTRRLYNFSHPVETPVASTPHE